MRFSPGCNCCDDPGSACILSGIGQATSDMTVAAPTVETVICQNSMSSTGWAALEFELSFSGFLNGSPFCDDCAIGQFDGPYVAIEIDPINFPCQLWVACDPGEFCRNTLIDGDIYVAFFPAFSVADNGDGTYDLEVLAEWGASSSGATICPSSGTQIVTFYKTVTGKPNLETLNETLAIDIDGAGGDNGCKGDGSTTADVVAL